MKLRRFFFCLILGVLVPVLIGTIEGGNEFPIWVVTPMFSGFFLGLDFCWKHGKKVTFFSLLSLGMLVFIFWPVTTLAGKALLTDFSSRSEPRRFDTAQIPIPWNWIKIHRSTGVSAVTTSCLTIFCHDSATIMIFDDETGRIKKGMSEEIWSREENEILQSEGFQAPSERSLDTKSGLFKCLEARGDSTTKLAVRSGCFNIGSGLKADFWGDSHLRERFYGILRKVPATEK